MVAEDASTFSQLIYQHERLVYRACYRVLQEGPAAEDAAQEAFVSAWLNRAKRRTPFVPWLLKIATNKCRDELRRRSRRSTASLDQAYRAGFAGPAETWTPETWTLNMEAADDLARALATLPTTQRIAIVLADIEGLAYRDIALATNTNVGTVKSRVSRGRTLLRLALFDAKAF